MCRDRRLEEGMGETVGRTFRTSAHYSLTLFVTLIGLVLEISGHRSSSFSPKRSQYNVKPIKQELGGFGGLTCISLILMASTIFLISLNQTFLSEGDWNAMVAMVSPESLFVISNAFLTISTRKVRHFG